MLSHVLSVSKDRAKSHHESMLSYVLSLSKDRPEAVSKHAG